MADAPKSSPALTPRALAAHQARAEREAAALRANLQRRKQQARDRAETPPPDAADPEAASRA